MYPREQEALKELRILTHNHALAIMAAAPDAGQLIEMLLKLVNARKTIEVGIFTGYSLLSLLLHYQKMARCVGHDQEKYTSFFTLLLI